MAPSTKFSDDLETLDDAAPALESADADSDRGDGLNKPTSRRAAPPPIAETPELRSGRLGRWLYRLTMLALLVTAALTYRYWRPWLVGLMPSTTTSVTKPPARPTPVSVAQAKLEDVDLFINALGTVTAFNTVTVKSRVDGELKRVAFAEGQIVKEGDLLVELDSRPLEAVRDQAQGQLQRDQAALELARVTLERSKALVARDATSQQEFDEQLALYRQAEATLNVDRANLQNAQLQVDYTRISAPISGRIGLRLVDRGNIVKANDPNGLLVITQLQPITLVFSIPQDEIHRVQKQLANNVELLVEAYNRDFTTLLATGKLAAIDNQVDATTGTLRIKAIFDNEDNLLFPNEFVNVRLKVETLGGVITVPTIAVQRGPKDRFVYVVKEDETVEVRTVVVGPSEGLRTVIESGLEQGERVVTEGVDKLQPGSKVSLPKAR